MNPTIALTTLVCPSSASFGSFARARVVARGSARETHVQRAGSLPQSSRVRGRTKRDPWANGESTKFLPRLTKVANAMWAWELERSPMRTLTTLESELNTDTIIALSAQTKDPPLHHFRGLDPPRQCPGPAAPLGLRWPTTMRWPARGATVALAKDLR